MFILLGIGIYRLLKHEKNDAERFDKNYADLKKFQLNVAKHLVNELGVQRDVLAQNQKRLTKDLNKALSSQMHVSKQEIEETSEHRTPKHHEKTSDEELDD